jgi:capsular exopolysaccharide synthesis family protein
MRLPRPAGPSQLTVPGAGVPAGTGIAPAFQMTGGDVWRVLRANLWLIFLFVTLAAVGGYYLNGYLAKNYSTYTSTGLVRIMPMQTIDPLQHGTTGMDSQSLAIEKNSEAQLIHSDGLINSVLSDSTNDIRQTDWWKNTCDGDPKIAHRLLSDKLVAAPILDSQLISVAMSASVPKDAETIVTALVDQAIKQKKEFIQNKNVADRQRLLEMKNRYETDLRNASSDVERMASELNMKGAGVSGGIGVKEMELTEKFKAQLAIQANYDAADNAYNTFMAELQQGQQPSRIQELVNADPVVAQYRNSVDALDTQVQELSGKLGENNPLILDRQRQRDLYQQKLRDTMAQKGAELTQLMKSDLLSQRDSAKKSLDAITASVSDVKREMADLSNKMATYFSRKEDQQIYREFVNQYQKALDDMDQMVRQADFSSLDWAQRPQEPDAPSFPKLPATMGAAIALGLMLSLGIAFLREITDTTVRSPRDIQRVGQMNLLGMVPHEADDPQASGCRLPLVIFEAPHSIMAEQFRQVRTRLQHAASLDTTRSILVTSPSPGDGKSTVAVNLAAGLALNGRRILLVDANFRRPELHRIFGVGNETGFSDCLNDINAFDSVVHETSVPNLSVMGSGVKPSNPTELLESQLLLDFIERALEEFDHVVFDSGPLLFVSESVALAPRVDGVVTVVRARTNTRGVLQRMRDGLRSVKAEHLGVVLNGVRSQAGGYYGRSIKTYYEYQNAG